MSPPRAPPAHPGGPNCIKDVAMKNAGEARRTEAGPVHVVCGSTLCELRVWGEAEWERTPPSRRPLHAVHVGGVGWIVAVPVACLN